MRKRCTRCRKFKQRFYPDPRQKSGLKPECAECGCRASKLYYIDHQTARRAYARRYQEAHKKQTAQYGATARRIKYQLVAEVKMKPCSDCGQFYPPYVMDLDHVRGRKLFALSQIGTRSIAAIKREIAKCDIVCANCHRERTFKRSKA